MKTTVAPKRVLAVGVLATLLTVPASAQPLLVAFSAENFPDGTNKPVSASPQPEKDVQTSDFDNVRDPLRGAPEIDEDDVDDFELFVVFTEIQSKVGPIEESPFSLLGQVLLGKVASDKEPTPDEFADATLLLESLANADPFFAYQGTLTNQTDEPLNAVLDFSQGVYPIGLDTPLRYETSLAGEALDTGGDGVASVGSVFASYGRTLSDVTNPTEANSTTREVGFDGLSNLALGAPQSDGTPDSGLFFTNLDVDFFDGLGVPEGDRGTIAMSAILMIEQLSPGDSFDFQIAFSIGRQDGATPSRRRLASSPAYSADCSVCRSQRR